MVSFQRRRAAWTRSGGWGGAVDRVWKHMHTPWYRAYVSILCVIYLAIVVWDDGLYAIPDWGPANVDFFPKRNMASLDAKLRLLTRKKAAFLMRQDLAFKDFGVKGEKIGNLDAYSWTSYSELKKQWGSKTLRGRLRLREGPMPNF